MKKRLSRRGNLADEYGTGIQVKEFGSEGQYGPVHDWQADPGGASVAAAANPGGRPDLQSWLDDRREAFDALVETYSGEELAPRSGGAFFMPAAGDHNLLPGALPIMKKLR